jgi:hypothetical protein
MHSLTIIKSKSLLRLSVFRAKDPKTTAFLTSFSSNNGRKVFFILSTVKECIEDMQGYMKIWFLYFLAITGISLLPTLKPERGKTIIYCSS